jgi:endonuclease YncB( thermonuclease family)
MSKPWKPGGSAMQVRPSRIRREPLRREPVRVLSKAEMEKAEARAREREIWSGVGGVVLFAAGIALLIVGISIATIFRGDDPAAAARAQRFGQCYNAEGTNCVLDGGTIYVGGERVQIAGIAAPQIQGAACSRERSRGIEAAVRLADLLNSGKVTLGRAFREPDGREVRKVQVDGEDVAATMIDAGVAREPGSEDGSWC